MGRKLDKLFNLSIWRLQATGRKLNKLFGRRSDCSKLNTLLGLTMAHIAILKNRRRVMCLQAKNDAAELLKLGHNDAALLRVEYAITEQNMVEAFSFMEGYCELLRNKLILLDNKICPPELKEAISSLIFSAARCGELPELNDIRWLFLNKYGKEFSRAAVELRNDSGVNCVLVQKLSTHQPSSTNRWAVLEEFAAELNLSFSGQNNHHITEDDQSNLMRTQMQEIQLREFETTHDLDTNKCEPDFHEIGINEHLMESLRGRKYNDATTAAEAAFEAATYATSAAKAAIQLSMSKSQG